jgi:hypothetical protein
VIVPLEAAGKAVTGIVRVPNTGLLERLASAFAGGVPAYMIKEPVLNALDKLFKSVFFSAVRRVKAI